ncbi:MAG TPA: hypothetical protein VKR52_00475 [Terracidiphilus sp.]|nr:hypothetical protein [Terracidiphilus sp.]
MRQGRSKSSQPGIVVAGFGTTICIMMVLCIDVRAWVLVGTLLMTLATLFLAMKANSLVRALSPNSVQNRSRQRRG